MRNKNITYPGLNKNFPDWDSPRFRVSACCGAHVEKVVFELSVYGIFSAWIGALALLKFLPTWVLALALVQILALGAVLCAIHKRKPFLYWPFLILDCKLIAAALVSVFMVTLSQIMEPQHLEPMQQNNKTTTDLQGMFNATDEQQLIEQDEPIPGTVRLLMAPALVICWAMSVWFYTLYWRSYSYLKAEVEWSKAAAGKQRLLQTTTGTTI